MKQLMKGMLAGLMVLSLGACAKQNRKADFVIDGSEAGKVVITADKTSKGAGGLSSFEVKEGDEVKLTSALEKGSLEVRIHADTSDAENLPDTSKETALQTWSIGTDPENIIVDLEAGSYTIYAEVTEKATGRVELTVTPTETSGAETAVEGEGQNPAMNFAGTYAYGRCAILVEPQGDNNVTFLVTWGSSASEHSEWTMSGKFDTHTLTAAYTDGVRKDVVFKEDGTVDKETVIYENGKGTFVFRDNGTMSWVDEEEQAAEGITFTYAN